MKTQNRAVVLCTVVLGAWPLGSLADAVTDWNANAAAAAIAACISPANDPLHESRLYAMTHVAIHDALNAIDRRSRPYAADFAAPAGASADAAVAAAARDVLVSQLKLIPAPFPPACLDAGVARVEADYASALAAIPEGAPKALGIGVGQVAAAAIVVRRAGDGSDTPLIDALYPQGIEPGEWRFTPDLPFAFAPGWRDVTPFVLNGAAQFRPGPPHAVSCERKSKPGHADDRDGCRKYAADLHEVKSLGGDGVTTHSARSAEQTEIALFWVESSPLQWNRIARGVSADRGLDPWQNARLFGLLNMAMADGYVATSSTKYHYNYWRPVTAIRDAHADGNPLTSADPTWTPLVTTPPVPDYESGHSVQGSAAAQVLKRVFGRDRIAFSTCSLTLPEGSRCGDAVPVRRSFDGFHQAALENGVSRVFVGFHFRKAVKEGIRHGVKIGEHAVDNFMQPVRHDR